MGLVATEFPFPLLFRIGHGQKDFSRKFPTDSHGNGHRQPSHLPQQDAILLEGQSRHLIRTWLIEGQSRRTEVSQRISQLLRGVFF